MEILDYNDYAAYPGTELRDRYKLAHSWIPAGSRRILDGGCAFGSGTRHFQVKDAKVWGVDPNAGFIGIAQRRYPNISFAVCGLEKTPFEAGFFDVIILNDVLEHVADENKTLNEMYRVLAANGSFIITTPHKGFFGFMDPDNYVYYLRTRLPKLYKLLFRIKYGKLPPVSIKPGYEELHRHYSLADFKKLLNESDFKNKYLIDKVNRSGLFMSYLASNIFELVSILVGIKFATKLTSWLTWFSDIDFLISYGIFSSNIGIRVKKTS